ncbi:hypothetical protein AEAC466_03400 [Asticcacaulis sp. AC466]|uniref:hypothetical protein n=1 Tax=Asticcacaulis sp. AC466 TaxID=1282362 RepID=UPI0003C3D93D|nr:hypothetical protein [Asticcacaulis sp. AC466]ESQ86255.1 hypothetical protein AEAC466_03400 [Asticcacaulis sp. AC466]
MSENADPNLPVPAGPVVEHQPGYAPRGRKRRAATNGDSEDAVYAAQLLSGGEKRGLRGGPETLERAKSTYLKSEYSGPNDRRPQPGRVTKTEI